MPPGTNGELSSSGKKLDGLLPIRLSNLMNNAKLTLTTTRTHSVVTLKVIALILDESVTKILKVSSQTSANLLVEQFLQSAAIVVDVSEKRVQLSVLQAVVDSISVNFDEINVGTLVGSTSNAVVRMVVEEKGNQLKREKMQEEQQKLRHEIEDQKRHTRELEKQLRENEPERAKQEDINMEDTEQEGGVLEEKTLPVENGFVENSEAKSFVENSTHIPQAAPNVPTTVQTPATQPAAPVIPLEKEDTVYLPQKSSKLYENPEDDYNMTMAQAETYYGIIKSMQKGRKIKKESKKPSKYVIRVRFPDRSLLDLVVDDSSLKLGQLLKRLDGYLEERYINTYKIKNGHPPFTEVAVGFSENNTALSDHPDFQLEKLLLIWETTTISSGPYLKQGIHTKDLSELPVNVLESQRGQLEEEIERGTPKQVNREQQPKKSKGLPKWFKP